jgi:uncharacterized protein YbjT (DUF2867 family)
MIEMSDSSELDVSNPSVGMDGPLFCHELPTLPQPELGTILVTGASGYIGGRLVPELVARGYKVRVMVRAESPEYAALWPGVEIVVADALNAHSMVAALTGVHTAFYLIHSLLLGPKDFESADILAARYFRSTAERRNVKRIIYLGGLGNPNAPLSSHLRNRMEVAQELQKGRVPVTVLRAAVIIGSGSASYEIICYLARKFPIVLIPRWGENRCQPIGVRDVLKYLVGCMETPETGGRTFDIGSKDILTYKEMLAQLAQALDKRIRFFPIPVPSTHLYSYIISLITPVPEPITRCLFDGLRNEVICQEESIRKLVPFETVTYQRAVMRALGREGEDDIKTSWSYAYAPAHDFALRLHELRKLPHFTSTYAITSNKDAGDLFHCICRIGGKDGWFNNNWMWRLRGLFDRLLLGVGMSRGRRSLSTLKINDVITARPSVA